MSKLGELKAKRNKWVILGACIIAEFLSVLIKVGYSPLIPLIKPELAITYTQTGIIFSAYLASYAVTQIPSGYMADRYSPRRSIPLAMLGIGIFTILSSTAQNFTEISIYRFAAGIAGGIIFTPLTKTLAMWFPSSERGKAIGLLMIGAGAASIASRGLIPLLASLYGWRNTIIIMGALPIALAPLIIILIRETPKQENSRKVVKSRKRLSFRTIFGVKDLWFIGLALFIYHIGAGVNSWLPMFIVEDLNVDYVLMGFSLGLLGVIGLPFGTIGGWLSDKFGRKPCLIIGTLLKFPTIMLITRLPFILTLLDLTAERLIGSCCGPTVLWAFAQDVSGIEEAGAAVGFVQALAQFGFFVGPTLAGAILDTTSSYSAIFDFFAILSLAIAALTYFIKEANIKNYES